MSTPDDRMIVAQIVIQEWLEPDGSMGRCYSAVDGSNNELDTAKAVGLLATAQHRLLDAHLYVEEDDDEH